MARWPIRGGYGIFFEHTNGNEGNTESLREFTAAGDGGPDIQIQGYANIKS